MAEIYSVRGSGFRGSIGHTMGYSPVLELAMSLLDISPRIPLGTFSILLTRLTDGD